jgi:hypothetical protein
MKSSYLKFILKKGSGKTFTISGEKTNFDGYGIIPRAVQTIFKMINNQASPLNSAKSARINSNSNHHHHSKDYCVKVNFIEIYKEELKDLLDSTDKDLQIREDEAGNTSNALYFIQFLKRV